MKQLIEEQKEEFIKDFCELKPYRDTDLIYFKGFCDKNYNLIPTPKTILQWHEETIKESLKQFIDGLITWQEEEVRHPLETIAHLKKLKEELN